MDKENLQKDLGLMATMAAYMGKHMKIVPGDRLVTEEELEVFSCYQQLAIDFGRLSEAINQLPEKES